MASSPRLPSTVGTRQQHNGSDASGLIKPNWGFDKLDDSSSVTSMSSVNRPAICGICKEPESKPTNPFVQCKACRRFYHPCCPSPPVLKEDWMDEKFKYICGYRKCQEKLAAKAGTASAPASNSTTPSAARTPSKTQQRASTSKNSTPYDISSATLSSPGAFRDSKKTNEFSNCDEPGCQVPLFRPIDSKERRLCSKHNIEKKNREAKAKAPLVKSAPSRGINKKSLHHVRPEDRQYVIKRKRSGSGKVPSLVTVSSPDQFTPMPQKERPRAIVASVSTALDHPPPIYDPKASLSSIEQQAINDIRNEFTRTSGSVSPKTFGELAVDATENISPSLKTPPLPDATSNKPTPSPDYEPPPPTVGGNGILWPQDQVFSDALSPRILGELRLGASHPSGVRSGSTSTSASVGQPSTKKNRTLRILPRNLSTATDSSYLPPTPTKSRQPFVRDAELLDASNLAYIDEIAAEHPDSPAKKEKAKESGFSQSQNPPVGLPPDITALNDSDLEMDLEDDASARPGPIPRQKAIPSLQTLRQNPARVSLSLTSPHETAKEIPTFEVNHLDLEVERNSQADLETDVDSAIAATETMNTQASFDSDDAITQSNLEYDPSRLDEWLRLQVDPPSVSENNNQQFIKSQIWAACDPRVIWPKAQADDFWEEKRKEVASRPRRKANFGSLLTQRTKLKRLELGWDIHQTRERDTKEESRIARHYEGIFGALFWDDRDTLQSLDSDAMKDTTIDVDVPKGPARKKKKSS